MSKPSLVTVVLMILTSIVLIACGGNDGADMFSASGPATAPVVDASDAGTKADSVTIEHKDGGTQPSEDGCMRNPYSDSGNSSCNPIQPYEPDTTGITNMADGKVCWGDNCVDECKFGGTCESTIQLTYKCAPLSSSLLPKKYCLIDCNIDQFENPYFKGSPDDYCSSMVKGWKCRYVYNNDGIFSKVCVP